MLNPIGNSSWVLCTSGLGYARSYGVRDTTPSHFPQNSLGIAVEHTETELLVFLPGQDKYFFVDPHATTEVDVYKTGKGFDRKICNRCFVLKSMEEFEKNQRDSKGNIVRRPSCIKCRQDIDMRPMTSKEAKEAGRLRPKKGTLFLCPICRKMSIAGVNVKVVADHDHRAGRSRDFLCESCNTGLGRFQDDQDILRNAIAYLKEHEGKP